MKFIIFKISQKLDCEYIIAKLLKFEILSSSFNQKMKLSIYFHNQYSRFYIYFNVYNFD